MPILALPPASARLGLARLDASRLAYTRSWWKAPTISRLAIKRMGGKRMGYAQPMFRASIDGVWRDASNVRIEGLSVSDELDGTPNTATARVQGFVPQAGMEVAFYLGDTAPWHRVFRGRILTCVQVYDLLPAHLSYDLSCISGEWRLNQYKVTERYLSMSATDIVLDLCATYVPWVDTSGVETGLESLAEITFTNEDLTTCLDRLKDRREIGGRWVLDYADVLHFGTTIEPGASAIHPIMDGSYHGLIAIAASTDLSQVRTRVRVEGGGSAAATELEPGETRLPVEDPVWYDPIFGGTVVSGPQRITYTGVVTGGEGALVGTSARPSNQPILTLATGSGIEAGPHSYAVVFKSASGTTLPSPSDSITIGDPMVDPPNVTSERNVITYPGASGAAGVLDAGARYDYQVTFYEAATSRETTPSLPFGNTLDPGPTRHADLSVHGAGPAQRHHPPLVSHGRECLAEGVLLAG